jgi:hypothetical protein
MWIKDYHTHYRCYLWQPASRMLQQFNMLTGNKQLTVDLPIVNLCHIPIRDTI